MTTQLADKAFLKRVPLFIAKMPPAPVYVQSARRLLAKSLAAFILHQCRRAARAAVMPLSSKRRTFSSDADVRSGKTLQVAFAMSH